MTLAFMDCSGTGIFSEQFGRLNWVSAVDKAGSLHDTNERELVLDEEVTHRAASVPLNAINLQQLDRSVHSRSSKMNQTVSKREELDTATHVKRRRRKRPSLKSERGDRSVAPHPSDMSSNGRDRSVVSHSSGQLIDSDGSRSVGPVRRTVRSITKPRRDMVTLLQVIEEVVDESNV